MRLDIFDIPVGLPDTTAMQLTHIGLRKSRPHTWC